MVTVMIGDTIVAVATPSGPGARAVIRLSGPQAFAAASRVFASPLRAERAQVDGEVTVGGARLQAMALTMGAPRSFTGEDVVELHVPGSPVLLRLLQEELLLPLTPHLVEEHLVVETSSMAAELQQPTLQLLQQQR